MTPRQRLPSIVLFGLLTLASWLALTAPDAAHAEATSSGHDPSITGNLECSECHTQDGWTIRNDGSTGGFDHSRTGFPLTGRHDQIACVGCHRADKVLTRQCSGCHVDTHRGERGTACDNCHSARNWQDVSAIELHRMTQLPLTGMHVLAPCTSCHRRLDEQQFTVPANCFACHADDYRRQDVHPLHTGNPNDPTQPPLPRDCALCHRATGWRPAFPPVSFTFRMTSSALRSAPEPKAARPEMTLEARRQHDLRFLISSGRHRGLDCSDCHPNPATPRRVLCTGCHAHTTTRLTQTHRRIGAVGTRCVDCHLGGRLR